MTVGFEVDYDRAVFGMQLVVEAFVGWSLLTLIGGLLSSSFKTYSTLPTGLQREWRGRITAFTHSVVAITCAIPSLLTFPTDDLPFLGEHDFGRITVAISCGYFLWDFLYIVFYWNSKDTNYFDIAGFLHGSLCFIVFFLGQSGFGMFIILLHLLFELSTPFLHIRWFLIQFELSGNIFATINDYVFVITFFFCRVVTGPIISYYYLSATWNDPTEFYHFAYVPCNITANLLNYYWFQFILRSALVASPAEKKKIAERKKNKKK